MHVAWEGWTNLANWPRPREITQHPPQVLTQPPPCQASLSSAGTASVTSEDCMVNSLAQGLTSLT